MVLCSWKLASSTSTSPDTNIAASEGMAVGTEGASRSGGDATTAKALNSSWGPGTRAGGPQGSPGRQDSTSPGVAARKAWERYDQRPWLMPWTSSRATGPTTSETALIVSSHRGESGATMTPGLQVCLSQAPARMSKASHWAMLKVDSVTSAATAAAAGMAGSPREGRAPGESGS